VPVHVELLLQNSRRHDVWLTLNTNKINSLATYPKPLSIHVWTENLTVFEGISKKDISIQQQGYKGDSLIV
jgi:hypothetical protein